MTSVIVTKLGIGDFDQDGTLWQWGPNSVGGWDIEGRALVRCEKPIKYITLYFVPYNAVNDAVGCETRGVSERGLQITGPINPNSFFSFRGADVWYNSTIKYVRPSRAEIQYMDGTTEAVIVSFDTSLKEPASGAKVGCIVFFVLLVIIGGIAALAGEQVGDGVLIPVIIIAIIVGIIVSKNRKQ